LQTGLNKTVDCLGHQSSVNEFASLDRHLEPKCPENLKDGIKSRITPFAQRFLQGLAMKTSVAGEFADSTVGAGNCTECGGDIARIAIGDSITEEISFILAAVKIIGSVEGACFGSHNHYSIKASQRQVP